MTTLATLQQQRTKFIVCIIFAYFARHPYSYRTNKEKAFSVFVFRLGNKIHKHLNTCSKFQVSKFYGVLALPIAPVSNTTNSQFEMKKYMTRDILTEISEYRIKVGYIQRGLKNKQISVHVTSGTTFFFGLR